MIFLILSHFVTANKYLLFSDGMVQLEARQGEQDPSTAGKVTGTSSFTAFSGPGQKTDVADDETEV